MTVSLWLNMQAFDLPTLIVPEVSAWLGTVIPQADSLRSGLVVQNRWGCERIAPALVLYDVMIPITELR